MTTREEWRTILLDRGVDEDTADLMCRVYADDEEDEP